MSGTGEVKFSQRQVFRARHFNIIRASGDQLRMEAAVLQRRGFIGDGRPLVQRPGEAIHQQLAREKLRGERVPQVITIDGMGDNAAIAVAEAAKDGKFLSKDDFRQRTKATKTVIDLMADLGLLGELPESNQLSLFDFA